jgi:uncharacterized protein
MQGKFSQFKARYILIDFILITVILGILLGVASAVTGLRLKMSEDPILLYSFGFLLYGLILLITLRKLKKANIQIKNLIGNTPLREIQWLMLFIVFYGIFTLQRGISQLTIFFSHLFFPSFTKSAIKSIALQYTYETDSLALKVIFYILVFVTVVIMAPVVEEFIFRGVILHRFAAKWGVTSAIVLSSFLFGIAHINIHAISIGVSWIFATLIYIKTKAMIVPITYHVMNNLIAIISVIVNMLSYPNDQIEITLQTLWGGLLNTIFALPILFYFLKWPSRSDLLPYAANIESANAHQPQFEQANQSLERNED